MLGTRPLATRLVAPEIPPVERSDPVTVAALQRFIDAHSTIADAPITIGLRGIATVTIDGDLAQVRGLLRAMICQLAVLHAPDQLLIVGAISDRNRAHWDWLKWLPHNQHPTATDAVGSRCAWCIAARRRRGQRARRCATVPHVVVVADLDERGERRRHATRRMTILEVGTGRDGAPLTIRHPGEADALVRPDQMDLVDALVCARRLAGYRAGRGVCAGRDRAGRLWSGIDDVGSFRPEHVVAQPRTTAIGSAFRSEPLPTVRRSSWTSRSPPKTAWVHTGSASAPPGRASRSCCAPSRWA